MITKKLQWEDKYSVGVALIDEQHQKMFATINELLEAIEHNDPEEKLLSVLEKLLQYKKIHFATEEKYFNEFNYEGRDEHIAKHKEFGEKLASLQEKYKHFTVEYAFDLVDFLEDWLIDHLMTLDQRYKRCFKEHGLS